MPLYTEWLAVAGGGAIGAVLRYAAMGASAAWLPKGFPWGTLLVNVLGSLLMGLAFVVLIEREWLAPVWRAFISVGLVGAFTTFSAFSLDALGLLSAGAWARAMLYIGTSVVTCIAAAMLGVITARAIYG